MALLASPLARAAARPKVVVLVDPTNRALWPRLYAELSSSGFDVVVSSSSAAPGPPNIEAMVDQAGATAAISLAYEKADAVVGVFIVDKSHTVFHEVITPPERPIDDALLAVRVVETLRGALSRVARIDPAPITPVAPPVETPVPAKPSEPRLVLGLLGGASYSPGGVGLMGELGLALRWGVARRVQIVIDGVVTPSRAFVQGPEGSALIGLYGAGVSLSAAYPVGGTDIRYGAGLNLCDVSMSGETQNPYQGVHTDVITLLPHLDLGVRVPLVDRLSLGAGFGAGFALPLVAVHFAGRETATWGQPLVRGFLAIEASLE